MIGFVNTYTCLLIVREMRARGLDPVRVARRVGLSPEVLDRPAGWIPVTQALTLLRALADACNDADLGLVAGRRAELRDLDIPGLLLRSSAHIDAARELYEKCAGPLGTAHNVEVLAGADEIVIRYHPEAGAATPRILHDLFLSSTLALTTGVLGPYAPAQVDVVHARPDQPLAYERCFGPVVRFSMPYTQLVIGGEVMGRQFPHHDELISKVLTPHLDRLPSIEPSVDLAAQVRSLVYEGLGAGVPRLTDVAVRLGVGARSLRRRLGEQGTTYVTLLDDCRRELALGYAADRAVSGVDIAQRLGYADPPAFYRAFRRWTGSSLSDHRRRSDGSGRGAR